MTTAHGGHVEEFIDTHFRIAWSTRTGVLSSIRTADEESVLLANGSSPVTIIVGGDAGENRLPEPPRAQGERLRQAGALVPFARPRPGERDGRLIGADSVYDGFDVADQGRDLAVTIWQREEDWRIGLTLKFDRVAPIIRLDIRVTYLGEGPADTLNWVWWKPEGWNFTSGLLDVLRQDRGFGSSKRLKTSGSVVFWRDNEAHGDGDFVFWGPRSKGSNDPRYSDSRDESGSAELVLYMGSNRVAGRETVGGGFVVGWSPFDDARVGDIVHGQLVRSGSWSLPDAPEWLPDAAIYETFIGYWPMTDQPQDLYSPYPTTEDLANDLERIRGLGFTTIYLMPRHPFPGYSTASLTNLAVQYGDGEGAEDRFAALVASIHAAGMTVILDVILHGVLDQEALDMQQERRQLGGSDTDDNAVDDLVIFARASVWDDYEVAQATAWRSAAPVVHPYWEEHPEWFTQLPDGRSQFTYSRSFDLRNPQLQSFLAESLADLVEFSGIDGYRFDAPWWNERTYRWQTDSPYRPSWSSGAGREILSRVFDAIRARGRQALLFSESTDATTARSAHLQYPYDEMVVIDALMSGEMSAEDGRQVLSYLRRIHAPGVKIARWVDAHDSVWWYEVGNKWKRERYGESAVRAATFFVATRDGAFMMFSGGEIGQEGWLTEVLELRRRIPVLTRGYCDELAIHSSEPSVFPVLRHQGRSWAIAVTSFSASSVTVELAGSPLSDSVQVVEQSSGQAFALHEGVLTLTLPAFGTALVSPEMVA